MAQEFKVGDVVQLKSGGPLMTVTYVGEQDGAPRVWCSWFVNNTKEEKGTFPPAALTAVSDEDLGMA